MATYPQYEWDAGLGRYRNAANGRLVGTADVRAALDRALRSEGLRARDLAEQLRAQAITVREFDAGMREVVKNTQLFSAAAGRGGWAQMGAREYGMVGARVREQYGFLAQFTSELRAGLGRDGTFLNRASSYAEAGRSLYHEVERDVREATGATEERSVLHPADHCAGCADQAALGWQPIGEAVPIGQRDCMNGCVCTMEYK